MMVQSLLVKLAMLGVTLGALVWIGAVTPIRQVSSHPSQPAPVVQVAQVRPTASATIPQSTGSSLPVTVPDGPAERTVEESRPESIEEGPATSLRQGHRNVARQVDLNRATASDLEALPGIGPKLAQRVIEHRAARGPFGNVEDLRQVKGIGRKKFDLLRPHVLVTNTRSLARHKGTP